MSRNNDFRTSNLSSQKDKIPHIKRKTSFWKIVLKVLLVLFWIFVIFFLSFGMISGFKWFFDKIKQSAIFSLSNSIGSPMEKDQYDSVNVLLLWYWWETHQWWFLTDSIMVASWNPQENSVVLFSIPRDLYVKSPVNSSYWRINAIFQQ